MSTTVRNYTRDEGGPFEVGSQVFISSHRKLLSSKAMVVRVVETPGQDSGRVGRSPKLGFTLPAWLERIVSLGIVSKDPEVVRRQRCVNVAAFAIAGDSVAHLVMNSLHDFRGLLPVNIYNLFMIALPLLIPRLHRFGELTGGVTLATLVLCAHMFVVWSFGLASDIHMYFTIMAGATLFFFGVQHWRIFFLFFALYVGALLISVNFAPVEGWVIPEDEKFREALSSQVLLSAITLNAAMLFYVLFALRRAELQLQDEHERSEALIQAVMPHPIAERLKSGEQHIADRIDMLSVMFADLAGFTEAAHNRAPEEVVKFLDGLVRIFDTLCDQHSVEKIKTIGDCYMAATGFDGRAAEGAVGIGRLALAMLDDIARQPLLGGRKLRLRIGIHSGPATAGVIGDTRFSYDVWGDAVNTASRMEFMASPVASR